MERDHGDGFLSFQEVKQWIIPDNFDHSFGEAKHLIVKADVDGWWLKEELLDEYDICMGHPPLSLGRFLEGMRSSVKRIKIEIEYLFSHFNK